MINLTTTQTQLCLMRLYRAVCAEEIPVQVGISDLYLWICDDNSFSKNVMGTCIVNAVIYEPRILINNAAVGKPTMSYSFGQMIELQYGLEWMICFFLRNYLHATNGPGEPKITTKGMMAEELTMLVNAPEDEYKEVYEQDIATFTQPYVNWEQHALNNDWYFREEMAKETAPPKPRPEKPAFLRNLREEPKVQKVKLTPPKDLSK